MRTVLIAEDELLVRIGIVSCVPWAGMRMKIIGEAEDGKTALSLYQQYHPDIVITDIRMPELDGISLIREIRKENHACAIIVITNVEWDETLEEARKLGVSEILLKATMGQEDITLAVKRVCADLPDKSGIPLENTAEHPWIRYLEGKSKTEPAEVNGLLLMHFRNRRNLPQHYRKSVEDLLLYRFSGNKQSVFVPLEEGMLVLFPDVPAKLRELLNETYEYIQDAFETVPGFLLMPHIPENRTLAETVRQIRQAVNTPGFDVLPIMEIKQNGQLVLPRLDMLRQNLIRFVPLMKNDDPLPVLSEELNTFPLPLQRNAKELNLQCGKMLRMLGRDLQTEDPMTLVFALCEAIEKRLDAYARSVRPKLLESLDYVSSHIPEDLSVERVSTILGLNAAYFSRLFKTELKINFTEYVTAVRISRARKYLSETDFSMQEIAERCGFSDVTYFSHRFKEWTGITPGNWRNRS